ncbi:EAL domain-containing protein [Pontibacterium granulatum]|uniref:EAL domain-containing protein n=1 Tax=Pontibacterium granulatum TaxID=2036029 RepID=UPI00249AE3EE|nr:EAL domain-containing protein [Pontibacterium granulatum]MDI3323875.1 EAL domain-containing protein [Pontibacterium granulatum]
MDSGNQYLLATLNNATHRSFASLRHTLRDKSALFKISLFTLLYGLCGTLTLSVLSVDLQILNTWLANGVALAVLLIGGIQLWPGILLGSILSGLSTESAPTLIGSVAFANTLGVLSAVIYLKHWYHRGLSMRTRQDYLQITIAGLICAATTATLGTLSHGLLGEAPGSSHPYNFVHWFQGDLLGVVVITVSILAWKCPPRYTYSYTLFSEVLFFGAMTLVVAFAIFADGAGGWLESYLMFAFVAWGGVRFKMHGALFVISICTLLGMAYLVEDIAINTEQQPIQGVTNLWMFLMALSVIGTILALAIQEKEQLENSAITRSEALQKLYQGAQLDEVIHFALRQIEKDNPEFRCCAVISNSGGDIDILSAPHISKRWDKDTTEALAALTLASATRKRFTVPDVQCDPQWKSRAEIAERLRIRSCYLQPIRGGNGKQLGIFALYKKYAGTPSGNERRLVNRISTLLALVVEQYRQSEELQLASLIFGNSSEAMTVTDANGLILAVNPAFTKVTGYEFSEVKGQKTSVLSSDLHDKSFYRTMWQSLSETGAWQGEIWNKKKTGELYPEWLTINTVYNKDGNPHRRVALFSDLSAQKESEKLIWQQANLDPLTSLPNRNMFLDLMSSAMCEADFSGLPVALLFIDLDRFKDVNDTLGHHQGDDLLKQVAKRISNCVRQSDVVARLGGDEFTVILKQVSNAQSPERVASDIINALSSSYTLDDNEVNYISASVGISLYPNDAQDVQSLLKNADQAMYTAKRQGRNRYQFFTPQMEEETRERIQLTSDLKTAICKQELVAYYQPIVDLQNNSVYKAELLLRWIHPVRGFVSPADFIPLAEETGIILEIGDWVFGQALQQVKTWRHAIDPRFQISVNASPIQFQDAQGKLSQWTDLLGKRDLNGNAITIEITENLLMQSGDQVTATLKGFRDAGMQISLDDFGTGYSSLSYLRQLDIDFLKIDQSFVRNLSKNSSELSLCEAIIVMAHKLGIKVVAEGIETEEQQMLLTQAGCDYGQGYLFSKPLPAAQFDDWYRSFQPVTISAQSVEK